MFGGFEGGESFEELVQSLRPELRPEAFYDQDRPIFVAEGQRLAGARIADLAEGAGNYSVTLVYSLLEGGPLVLGVRTTFHRQDLPSLSVVPVFYDDEDYKALFEGHRRPGAKPVGADRLGFDGGVMEKIPQDPAMGYREVKWQCDESLSCQVLLSTDEVDVIVKVSNSTTLADFAWLDRQAQ